MTPEEEEELKQLQLKELRAKESARTSKSTRNNFILYIMGAALTLMFTIPYLYNNNSLYAYGMIGFVILCGIPFLIAKKK